MPKKSLLGQVRLFLCVKRMRKNGIQGNKKLRLLPLGWGIELVVRHWNLPHVTLERC